MRSLVTICIVIYSFSFCHLFSLILTPQASGEDLLFLAHHTQAHRVTLPRQGEALAT